MVSPTDAEVIGIVVYLNTLESERAKTSWITTVIDGKEISLNWTQVQR